MNSMQHSLTLQTDPPLAPPRLDEPAPCCVDWYYYKRPASEEGGGSRL